MQYGFIRSRSSASCKPFLANRLQFESRYAHHSRCPPCASNIELCATVPPPVSWFLSIKLPRIPEVLHCTSRDNCPAVTQPSSRAACPCLYASAASHIGSTKAEQLGVLVGAAAWLLVKDLKPMNPPSISRTMPLPFFLVFSCLRYAAIMSSLSLADLRTSLIMTRSTL